MKNQASSQWQIESLGKSHNRSLFDCGIDLLNLFLKTQARQQQEKHIDRTFVATAMGDDSKKVLGFYTLSAGSVQFENLPIEMQSKLPKYPIPVARLGRLAVDLFLDPIPLFPDHCQHG